MLLAVIPVENDDGEGLSSHSARMPNAKRRR